MTPEEVRATADLTGRAVAGAAGTVEHTHRSISTWTLRRLGLSPHIRGIGAIRDGVYSSIRVTAPVVATLAGHIAAARVHTAATPLASTPRGGRLQAALNGAVGDALESTASPLAVRMSLRANGADVNCERAHLTASFPEASSRIALFVHGLCHDENAWTPPPDPRTGDAQPSHGDRLSADTDVTSLHLRYNSGRHVSENGTELARLLARLLAEWPVPMTDLVLIGHSMGGLVIRSACDEAARTGDAWLDVTRLVVTLGTPHTGAPLEQFAAAAERRLDAADVTRGLAGVFHARSSGIKDLRRGYTSAAEWAACDQDACPHDHRRPVPVTETARHLVIATTVTSNPRHPLGRAVGDLLVRTGSALGQAGDGRHIDFPADSSHVVGGITHLGMMHDPRVYEQIRAGTAACW